MKLNVPMNLKLSKRYYLHNRQWAIKDAFDALVELITNADDSYHRLYKRQLRAQDGGRILVETCASNKNNSVLIVRDKAEGMTLQVMSKKLSNVGDRSSEEGDRGFMARGAKDCSELGNVIFESIVEDKYYKATITSDADFIALEDGKSVNHELRKCLHIEKGNGTVVTIEFTRHRLPRPSSICENLPLHFALRDIMTENSPCEVLFRDMNDKENKLKKLAYYQPQGDLVCKEEFVVQGYPNAEARLVIFKSPEPLEDISDKFRKSGIIIKGKRGIHECSLLQPSFEKDTHGKKYFGRVECEYIDFLMDDYDNRIENREPLLLENPSLVVDPNRQGFLNRSHPFVAALLDIPTKRLKALIDQDHAANKKSGEEIADEDLKNRFNKLAKAASKFLIQQTADLEIPDISQEIEQDSFIKRGILIYPTYANIALDESRSFGLYVNRNIFNKEGAEVSLKSDSEAIEFINPVVTLIAHKTKRDLLYGRFTIKGLTLKERICIETNCEELPKAEALINVVESKIEQREFTSSLEFEHVHYKIKEGSTKLIRLFAKYPEIVNADTDIKVVSSDNVSLPVKGKCILVPVQGSNFAMAEINIEARRLCQGLITLLAKLSDVEAITKIKVVQKEESGPPLKIEIRDEDFGTYRAKWGDYEKPPQPYLLLISARHSSLSRYLGPAPDFVGRNSSHFKAILAEIVAERVCWKSLSEDSKQRSWMFKWADLKEDNLIAETVISELQKRMKEFLPVAHQIMVEQKEINI